MLIVIAVCLFVLAYTYVGYPLLIALLARLSPKLSARQVGYEPTVTACIPAYNVAEYLDQKIRTVLAQEYPAEKLDVLVYVDGSTDDTLAIAERWAQNDRRVRVIRGEERLGKPSALNIMRQAARGQLLLLTDARQTLDAGAVRALVAAMSDPNVGCATGNLCLTGGAGSGMYWRYENWIRKQESKYRSVVGVTGPITMLRKAELAPVPTNVILDDVLIPMRLRLEGKRIVLVEDARAYDVAFGDAREFGRKTRTLAGNYQIFSWMPELLLPWKNPSWLETFSHKVLRLAGPWLLIALLVCSVQLVLDTTNADASVAWGLLGAQLVFYGAAALGDAAGKLGRLARTFLMMNVAAQVGLWRYLRGRQAVTW